MSIFREFGGKSSYYTEGELDRLQNPEKYNYTQETYDAYSAQVQKKADSRQAAAEVAQDAIPYSYVGRGTGSTNPAFSFAGYGGHTSGGTSGLSGFGGLAGIFGAGSTTETTGGNTGNQGGPQRGPGGNPREPEGETQLKAEGGAIYPVQNMEAGGMITSPFANPMKQTMGSIPMNQPDMGPGIDGIFKQLQQQNDNQMNMMMSSPLQVYSQYLNKTYVQPEAEGMVGKVEHFVDLVDQAERAHFGVDESFGFGEFGNPIQRPPMQNAPTGPNYEKLNLSTHGPNDGLAAMPPMSVGTFGPNDGMAGGIASLPPAFSY